MSKTLVNSSGSLTDGSIKNGEFELRLYGTKAYLLEDWEQFVEIPWVKVILYEV